MAQQYTVGLDIGTYHVKVVVVEAGGKPEDLPKILGTGFAESRGMRYGYIINPNDVAQSVHKAVKAAQKAAGVQIREAFISMGGVSVDSITTTGTVIISRADSEVTSSDIGRAIEACGEAIPKSEIVNKKIIHTIPVQYAIDGKKVLGRPAGLKGTKLEVSTLFVTCFEQHLHDLVEAVESTGVAVLDVVAAPFAASIVNLTKAQKIAGCVLANIGSETVSIAVFENNLPVSLAVFPIGSTDITNDIALTLKIPLEDAEQLKRGGIIQSKVSRKQLDDIVAARLTDIFEIIQAHLRKIKKHQALPAGIIITGGGSGISTIDDLAKGILKLPSRVAQVAGNNRERLRDASWSVAYGLAVIALEGADHQSLGLEMSQRAGNQILSWIKSFLP